MSQKFNATQLKYAMAALMVLDHIPHIPGPVPPLWTAIFHALTRCVGVWFAYMAVEGFIHTSNLKRYNLRLFGWAIFMAVGNFLLGLLVGSKGIYTENNIFLTLAVGVFLLSLAFSRGTMANLSPILRWIGAVLLLLVGAFLTEGGMVILPFMLITYACRQKPALRNSLYLLFIRKLKRVQKDSPYDIIKVKKIMLGYQLVSGSLFLCDQFLIGEIFS